MKNINELSCLILEWGKERGIADGISNKEQLIKFFAEAGELADAVAKNDKEAVKDGIGDVLVTLVFVAYNSGGLGLNKCLEYAYEQIKNRTGKTVNGVFIKDE